MNSVWPLLAKNACLETAEFALLNAEFALSNAGCTWGATLFALLNAELALLKAALAYAPALSSAIGALFDEIGTTKLILLLVESNQEKYHNNTKYLKSKVNNTKNYVINERT